MLLEIREKYNTDLQYPFLLKKVNPEWLNEWMNEMKLEIQKMDAQLLELSLEKSEQEKRNDCLDKEIRLGGVLMRMEDVASRKKRILEVIDFIQVNSYKINPQTD